MNDSFAKDRVQQRPGFKWQLSFVVVMHQDNGGQAPEYRPGEEAPMKKTLRQRRCYRISRIRSHSEKRRRIGEMSYRLGRSPKYSTTGKQGAHDDSHPLERRHFRRFNATERGPTCRRHANQDCRKKGKQ